MTSIHRKSSDRKFEKFITKIDGKPIGVRRLFCSTPGCGQQGELLDRTTDGLPSDFIVKKFEQKKWSVGNSEKHDACPSCVERERIERRKRRSTTRAINLKIVDQEPVMSAAPTAVEAPTSMGRDDRRIIFSHLQECYIDEKSGYRTPWTDAAVARHLGVPAAWVVQLRDENFGPAHDNQEIRDMLDRVERAAIDASQVLEQAKAIRKEGSAMVERINNLNRQAVEVGQTLNGLLAIADRIKKAVE